MSTISTVLNNNHPCFFGRTNAEDFHLMHNAIIINPIYFGARKKVKVWVLGEPREFLKLQNENELLIFWGRLYKPFFINSKEKPNSLKFNSLIDLDYEGNFISIHIEDSSERPNIRLLTDKFGSRLLLYYYDGKNFFFSSHLFGLKTLLQKKLPTIDPISLSHYYHFRQTSSISTLLKDIMKVPPGSILEFNGRTIRIQNYFDPLDLMSKEKSNIKKEILLYKLNSVLVDSIRLRTTHCDQIGLSLSSGVDSGLIAKLLSKKGKEFICYNLAYKNYYDEHKAIDSLSKKYFLLTKKIELRPDILISQMNDVNKVSSEPTGFNDAAMSILWNEAKKDKVDTMLEGGGADHLFFGMNRYKNYLNIRRIYNLIKSLKMNNFLIKLFSCFNNNEIIKIAYLYKNWSSGIPPYPKRVMGSFSDYDYEQEIFIFNLGVKSYYDKFLAKFSSFDLFRYFTYQTIKMDPEEHFYPPSELQLDLGMFPVSPYWDLGVVKIALNLPNKWKIRRSHTKYFLRKTAALDFDVNQRFEHYWFRKKMGLQNAYKFLLSNPEGKIWVESIIKEIINKNYLNELIGDNKKFEVFRLIPFYMWHKNLLTN